MLLQCACFSFQILVAHICREEGYHKHIKTYISLENWIEKHIFELQVEISCAFKNCFKFQKVFLVSS